MKLIGINLYPYKKTEDNKIMGILEKFLPPVFIALSIAVFLNVTLFIMSLFTSSSFTHLEKQWKERLPKANAFVILKKDVNILKDKHQGYLTIMNFKIETAKVLSDVFAALPRNIWLDEFGYNNKALIFIGYAARWKEEPMVSVDTFIKNLKKCDLAQVFKEINLRNSRKVSLAGTEVIKFEIECKSVN